MGKSFTLWRPAAKVFGDAQGVGDNATAVTTRRRLSTIAADPVAAPPLASILVVDDEPEIRSLLADVLGELGYATDTAADGVEDPEAGRRHALRPGLARRR